MLLFTPERTNCLWRCCRSWGTKGQQATPYVRGWDFPHEIFHLILRQSSFYFLNRKVGLISSQEPSFYIQHITNPLVSHVCTGYPVQQTASLFLSQIVVLQLTQQISFNISRTPVFSSNQLPGFTCRKWAAVRFLFSLRDRITPFHMPETHVAHDAQECHDTFDTCLLTYPFWSFFDPSTEAAAILFNMLQPVRQTTHLPRGWGEGWLQLSLI